MLYVNLQKGDYYLNCYLLMITYDDDLTVLRGIILTRAKSIDFTHQGKVNRYYIRPVGVL